MVSMNSTGTFKSLAAAALVALTLPAVGMAQSIVSTGQSFVSAHLLPGSRQEDGSRLAGLRLTMTPGWKTYWRTPGQAGIPPKMDWTASRNVATVEVLWPRPYIFMSFGMRTVGYEDEVVLPLHVTPVDPDQPIHLSLTAELGVCEEICVLEAVTVAEDIAADLRPIGYRQIRRAMRAVPVPAATTDVHLVACSITGQGDRRQLNVQLSSPHFDDMPEVLVEGSNKVWVYMYETSMDGADVTISADLQLPGSISWVDRSALRFTVLGADYAADIQGCIPTAG